jgi:hypothetical protein
MGLLKWNDVKGYLYAFLFGVVLSGITAFFIGRRKYRTYTGAMAELEKRIDDLKAISRRERELTERERRRIRAEAACLEAERKSIERERDRLEREGERLTIERELSGRAGQALDRIDRLIREVEEENSDP